jgi:lipid-A-disaccharide synthase
VDLAQHDRTLLVVAGERSSDRIAARALGALSARAPVGAFGIGGDALEANGVDLVAHVRDLAAIGFGAIAARLGAWTSAWARLRAEIEARNPAVALLVDAPEVNLPLARILKARGCRVVQYVGPQVWAWRRSRLRLLRSRTDHVALILPFEKALYDAAGVRATYVGHPLLDEPSAPPRDEARRALGVSGGTRLVALLPGSRCSEVAAHAPPMLEAARLLRKEGISCAFSPAPDAVSAEALSAARSAGCLVPAGGASARDVLAAADAAIVASGTATLEAAIAGTPLAVVYRLGPASALAARALVRVPYVGLPNWIAGRRVVPELLLGDATAPRIAEAARALLTPETSRSMRRELALVRSRLGAPGACERVAEILKSVW